jgi:hypothetical protein
VGGGTAMPDVRHINSPYDNIAYQAKACSLNDLSGQPTEPRSRRVFHSSYVTR